LADFIKQARWSYHSIESKPKEILLTTEPIISPTLVVLAAGMGSRYGGLKQIEPIGPSGETIIDYSIYDAMRAGFAKVVFVIRKQIEHPFRLAVGQRFEKQVAVDYVFQELDKLPSGFSVPIGRTKPWGTTQAILMAADVVQEPFAVINADDFYGVEGYQKMAQHLRSGTADYAMVGYTLRNTLSDFGGVARGVCQVSGDDFLKAIVELTQIEGDGQAAQNTDASGNVTRLTGEEVVSMNFWGFSPQVFGHLEEEFCRFLAQRISDLNSECYIPSAVNTMVHTGIARVRVLRTGDAWFGVTYREDHLRVIASIRSLIRDGLYPERLWL